MFRKNILSKTLGLFSVMGMSTILLGSILSTSSFAMMNMSEEIIDNICERCTSKTLGRLAQTSKDLNRITNSQKVWWHSNGWDSAEAYRYFTQGIELLVKDYATYDVTAIYEKINNRDGRTRIDVKLYYEMNSSNASGYFVPRPSPSIQAEWKILSTGGSLKNFNPLDYYEKCEPFRFERHDTSSPDDPWITAVYRFDDKQKEFLKPLMLKYIAKQIWDIKDFPNDHSIKEKLKKYQALKDVSNGLQADFKKVINFLCKKDREAVKKDADSYLNGLTDKHDLHNQRIERESPRLTFIIDETSPEVEISEHVATLMKDLKYVSDDQEEDEEDEEEEDGDDDDFE